MRKSIIVYRPAPDAVLEKLRAQFDVAYLPEVKRADEPAFREALAGASGLLGASVKIGPDALAAAPALEVVSSISVGYDNYDVAAFNARGVLLTNTPDVLTETTADTAFMLILMACRRAVELAEYVKAGKWKAGLTAEMFGTDVHGKTLGILGLGRIGAAVARRGRFGFGMDILYHARSPKPELEAELGARRLPFDDLLRAADIVCCLIPLEAETRHLIGERAFSLMGADTVFVNASRGAVVDEVAMIAALRAGTIKAAGLDVFEQEPLPASSPLPAMPNVVALPHIGSATHETRAAMLACAVDNLSTALAGGRPPNLVNAEAYAV